MKQIRYSSIAINVKCFKMKFRSVTFFLCLPLVVLLSEVTARPQKEDSTSKVSKTKQNNPRTKHTRVSKHNLPEKNRVSQVSKQRKGLSAPSPLKRKDGKEQKRQFISRPMGLGVPPFVLMRRPPLTQRTIVTTHIPRPPITVPYNAYNPFMMPGSLYGGMRFPYRRFHHGYSDIYDEGEEDEDEGACQIKSAI